MNQLRFDTDVSSHAALNCGRSGWQKWRNSRVVLLSKKEKMMKLQLLLKISWRIEWLILYMEITMFLRTFKTA